MANYNRTILMGNLTADPEKRFTKDGSAVTNFTVAVNGPPSKDPDREDEVLFMPGHQQEIVLGHLLPLNRRPRFRRGIGLPLPGGSPNSSGQSGWSRRHCFRHGINRLLCDPGQVLSGGGDDWARNDRRTMGCHPDNPHGSGLVFKDHSDQTVGARVEPDHGGGIFRQRSDQEAGALHETGTV